VQIDLDTLFKDAPSGHSGDKIACIARLQEAAHQ